jgi:hypothetical protein
VEWGDVRREFRSDSQTALGLMRGAVGRVVNDHGDVTDVAMGYRMERASLPKIGQAKVDPAPTNGVRQI